MDFLGILGLETECLPEVGQMDLTGMFQVNAEAHGVEIRGLDLVNCANFDESLDFMPWERPLVFGFSHVGCQQNRAVPLGACEAPRFGEGFAAKPALEFVVDHGEVGMVLSDPDPVLIIQRTERARDFSGLSKMLGSGQDLDLIHHVAFVVNAGVGIDPAFRGEINAVEQQARDDAGAPVLFDSGNGFLGFSFHRIADLQSINAGVKFYYLFFLRNDCCRCQQSRQRVGVRSAGVSWRGV